MASKYRALLEDGIGQLGLDFSLQQYEQLELYISEIELFNPIYKLVGASGDELVKRHIFDCLAGVSPIGNLAAQFGTARIADLGSGAGLPGIPLAIALVNHSFTLVERMGRRVDFLRNALVRTALASRVAVFDQDLKQVHSQYDIVTFRAFHPLVDILDDVAPVLSPGGVVCAYKAQPELVQQELRHVEEQCKDRWSCEMVPLTVPYLAANRMLCLMQKI